jgi:hypothetical protein
MYAKIAILYLYYKDGKFIKRQSLKRNNQSLEGCKGHYAEPVSR